MQPEINNQQLLDNLSVLQAGRFNLAVHTADMQLKSVFAHDRTENPEVSISKTQNDDFLRYSPSLSANDLLGLSALGLEPETVVKEVTATKLSGSMQVLKSIEVGNERLEIYAAEDGLKIGFNVKGVESAYGNTTTPTAIDESIKKRFAKSPAHQAMSKVKTSISQSPETPHGVTTEPFDPAIDPLGTLAFLEDIGLASGLNYRFREGKSVESILEYVVNDIPDFKATIEEGDGGRNITWSDGWANGVKKTLHIDNLTGTYQFSAVQDPTANYFEQGNQTAEKAVPFIETECARELCSILDKTGLMFHPRLQAEMMGMGEADRYGSIYTQMSREIAKWVDNPDRAQLSNLFVPLEAEFYGNEMAERMTHLKSMPVYEYSNRIGYDSLDDSGTPNVAGELQVREKWASASHDAEGEAATVLLRMIDDAITRDPLAEQTSDLPVTKQEIHIRDGACFDVTTYYVSAATRSLNQRLKKTTHDGVTLLEKTMGSHTFLSTEPMVFNGVQLPKGALFLKNDDGWAFTRLTMFAFDKPEDQIAVAGSELAKTLKNEVQSLREIGGTTLKSLIGFARTDKLQNR